MSEVLVLNKHWVPIRIISMFDAICKAYSGKAYIVGHDYVMHDWDSWIGSWDEASMMAQEVIHAANLSVVVPKVIVMKNYIGYVHKKSKLSRKNIYVRDDYTCQYCGKTGHMRNFNIDHVIPKSKGGKTTWTNMVLSCLKCNQTKADRTPEQAGMKLIRKPFEPKWHQLHHDTIRKHYDSWKDLLGDMYWNVELEK